MPRIKSRQGEWFGVPLPNGGYGLALVARHGGPILAAYFFGPRHNQPPSFEHTVGLTCTDAVLGGVVSYLGIKDGTWVPLGRAEPWVPDEWPMPPLVRYEELTGRYFRVILDENDPGLILDEIQVDATAEGFRDHLMGSKAAAVHLDYLLD